MEQIRRMDAQEKEDPKKDRSYSTTLDNRIQRELKEKGGTPQQGRSKRQAAQNANLQMQL